MRDGSLGEIETDYGTHSINRSWSIRKTWRMERSKQKCLDDDDERNAT
jgi:hypothetical protein